MTLSMINNFIKGADSLTDSTQQVAVDSFCRPFPADTWSLSVFRLFESRLFKLRNITPLQTGEHSTLSVLAIQNSPSGVFYLPTSALTDFQRGQHSSSIHLELVCPKNTEQLTFLYRFVLRDKSQGMFS